MKPDQKEAAIQRLAEAIKHYVTFDYGKREIKPDLFVGCARIAIEKGVMPTAMEMRGVSDRKWMERHIPWDAVAREVEKP